MREYRQNLALQVHLQKLREESPLASYLPSSPETTLISRYVGVLGPEPAGRQPFEVLGTWIQSIPSRIGSNKMLDLAVQFFVDSHATYRDDMHSKRKVARASKAKALKELQLAVMNTDNKVTYDILLATKLHYAAEVHEAMMSGRKSVYHNDYYLSATIPPPINTRDVVLSPSQRASMAVMHVFIQCPYAVALIREAISNPEDTTALAIAMSYLEGLMQIDVSQHVAELIETTVSVVPIPPSPNVADLMPDTLEFNSVQDFILCTRSWMLQSLLYGLADTLYRYFPAEAALSLLPSPQQLRIIDVDSALWLQKSHRWADSVSKHIPLLTMRLHTPLQMAIAPWHRMTRDLTTQRSPSASPGSPSDVAAELTRAKRMQAWIVNETNKIHKNWNVATVDEEILIEALEALSGEKMPDWLPTRVRFVPEEGEMALHMEFENRTGTYSTGRIDVSKEPPRKLAMPPHPGEKGQEWQRKNVHVVELPLRGGRNERPVDFLHSTGRNLCTTSGWWPQSHDTSHNG
ncbi:uncharacterized protein J4E78_001589 [Alternaria triticimaculans]|uniref:uncharacterized protein n=1 Tax=Alternaria triticimaculans TaxID=297637 RepID=UPI0020C29187|nr:uncharacterized protein J4E78_001589 [Alternaria triticimaculans]KAI4673083.1 hypothetical protein J4E78_001589 [Alternaria triticimaculans]